MDGTSLQQVRKYGKPPFRVAVVHGGPGALGQMAPVARELSRHRGVLEPIQSKTSLEGQVEELSDVLATAGAPPVSLVGHSWGAWLSVLVAARHPELVRKLILVSSGPFEDSYAKQIGETRARRLSPEEAGEFDRILRELAQSGTSAPGLLLERLGALASKADAYDPLPEDPLPEDPGDSARIPCDASQFRRVWEEASRFRASGELLREASRLRSPVVAIHGDFDPHPAEGVREPLSRVLPALPFHLLARCGHVPWQERQAREVFFQTLEQELAGP